MFKDYDHDQLVCNLSVFHIHVLSKDYAVLYALYDYCIAFQ